MSVATKDVRELCANWRIVIAAMAGWGLDAFDFTMLLFLIPHLRTVFDATLPEMALVITATGLAKVVGPIDYRDGLDRETGQESGARALGIENLAVRCMQGRAVMVDLAAHFGEQHATVGYEALMRILEADEVAVEAGDFVCFRTGFDRLLLSMGKQPDADRLALRTIALDGADVRLQRWITETGVVALIADNPAVERLPGGCCGNGPHASHPLHEHCLFRLGVYLGELWHLSELADWLREHGRNRFLLTAPPLRLPGAVGAPATPVATV